MRRSSLAWMRQVSMACSEGRESAAWSMFGVPASAEALVGPVQMALHGGARGVRVAPGDRIEHEPMLGDGARPLVRAVVMMLEPGKERPRALFPQHLHHGDQRAIAGGLRDAQMEQPVRRQGLAVLRVRGPLHLL